MTFSTANLATVAYGFAYSDGSTPDLNSGVVVTKRSDIDNGVYEITLPGDPGLQEPLQQGQGGPFVAGHLTTTGPIRDLIMITPSLGQYNNPVDGGISYLVREISSFTKRVYFFDSAGDAYNTAFYFMILRSTIPVPTNSEGVPNGPG